jgi:hypothetical protein
VLSDECELVSVDRESWRFMQHKVAAIYLLGEHQTNIAKLFTKL